MKIFARKLGSFLPKEQRVINQIASMTGSTVSEAIKYYEAVVSFLYDKYRHKLPRKVEHLLHEFMTRSPKAGQVPIYRGVSMPEIDFNRIKSSKLYQPRSYSHWSTSKDIAMSYLDERRPNADRGVNVLFQCPTAHSGVDLEYIAITTPFGIEKEVLMPVGASFKVMSIQEVEPDNNSVSLSTDTYYIVKVVES